MQCSTNLWVAIDLKNPEMGNYFVPQIIIYIDFMFDFDIRVNNSIFITITFLLL